MFIEVIMGWKHISKLHQIYVPSKECVGECIDGIKYPKILYVESLTTGMENHSPTVTIKLEWKIKIIKNRMVMVDINRSISLFLFYPNYIHRLGNI